MTTFFKILPSLLFILIFVYLLLEADKEKKELDKSIGTEVIIKNDTLLITHYNKWSKCYILSNGIQLNPKLLPYVSKNNKHK